MRRVVGVIAIVIILLAVAVGYYYISAKSSSEKSIRVLAAGSLAVPLQEMASKFNKEYGIKVYIETAGSIQTVKKVSELGVKADVVAVADYMAIKSYLVPKYTDWYIKFAKNELVIVYTNHSRYSSIINSTNWMSILEKGDVHIGFSSPNDDPCGYRAVMLFYLAQLKYHTGIFNNVILNNTGMKLENGTVMVPPDSSLMKSTGKVFIKQKSVDLLADVESGNIDYAIEYLSVAKQHHLRYVRLSDYINLGNSSLTSWYQHAKVKLADGRIMQGKPINYALTVPFNAPHKDYAYKFVNFLLGNEGKEILEKCGQQPIYEEYGTIPREVKH